LAESAFIDIEERRPPEGEEKAGEHRGDGERSKRARVHRDLSYHSRMSDLSQLQVPQLQVPSMRSRVSPQEWQTRIDLAACYRLVHHYRMDDLVYNHISARVPGEEGHFLINAYGMTYDEISASSLVKIDFDGKIVQDSGTGYG